MNEWLEYVDGNRYMIHFGEMLKLLLRNIGVIILVAVVFGGGAFAFSTFCITPLYQSSIKMYVNNSSNTSDTTSITSSDISASQNLVDTYAVVLTSMPTIDAVIKQTGVEYSYSELCSMISTEAINETEIFRVTVTSADPEEAADIANAIAKIAPDEIMEIVSGSSVKIVEYATAAASEISPDRFMYAVMGFASGFVLSCIVILLLSFFRNGMSVEEKIRKDFKDKAVLSVIPLMGEVVNGKHGKKKMMIERAKLCDKLSFASAEAYKLLRENIAFYFSDVQECRIIGVTSSVRNEGKTTTAINLAYTLALANKKVCLIDCDFRLPSVAKRLRLRQKPGMTNLLAGQPVGHDTFQKHVSRSAAFYVVTAGDIPPNPSELLGSKRMQSVLEVFSKNFDYIILDLPPVGIVSDALAVTKVIDGMLFVVREDFYERRTMRESLRILEGVETKLLGMVVTYSTTQQKEYKRYGSKYGTKYGYKYGYDNNYGRDTGDRSGRKNDLRQQEAMK